MFPLFSGLFPVFPEKERKHFPEKERNLLSFKVCIKMLACVLCCVGGRGFRKNFQKLKNREDFEGGLNKNPQKQGRIFRGVWEKFCGLARIYVYPWA